MSRPLRHVSCSIERRIERPRRAVWKELVAFVDSELADAARLSVEPPWRLCVDLADQVPDLDFVQVTFVLRDDGSQCHLAAGIVVEPEPTEAGLAARDRLIRRVESHVMQRLGDGDLSDIVERFGRLPILDDRHPDEIIGYDENGLPS